MLNFILSSLGQFPKGAVTGPGFIFAYILPYEVGVKGSSTSFHTVRIGVTEETPYENDIGALYTSFKKCREKWEKTAPKGSRGLKLPNKDSLGMDPKKMRWQQFVEKIAEDKKLPEDKKKFSDLVFVYWTRNTRACDQDIILNFLPRVPHHYMQALSGAVGFGEEQIVLMDTTQIDNLRVNFMSHRVTNCYTVLKIVKLPFALARISESTAGSSEDDVPVFLPYHKIAAAVESFETLPSTLK